MINNSAAAAVLNSPVRSISGRVELLKGSALLDTYYHDGRLKGLTITRAAEVGKFFGFGVCQKLNVQLIDNERELDITTANALQVYFNTQRVCPAFSVSEVNRDENTNALSITAYDAIYRAAEHTVAEITLESYTLLEFAAACAALLGLASVSVLGLAETDASFSLEYSTGANFDGTESIREALNAIAEATQTIYYIDHENSLVFKRLDRDGAAVLTIDKSMYITLDSGDNRRLAAICHATELGDNVSASITETGTTQYMRDNPFLELREDIADIIDSALAAVGGLTINQFNCAWRGNYLLEVGDKIELITKDGGAVLSYLLDSSIEYNGAFAEATQWSYTEDEAVSAENPTGLGEILKQTYARVDKANKEIALVASTAATNSESIASLSINTNEISAAVKSLESNTNDSFESMSESIAELASQVELKMSAEDVTLEIKKEIANGAGKVETSTGFRLDDEGLTISKSDSDISTKITENGMSVSDGDNVVLTANHDGVQATDLHATTYLIIGANSRFEDYVRDGEARTGCFWIGGN